MTSSAPSRRLVALAAALCALPFAGASAQTSPMPTPPPTPPKAEFIIEAPPAAEQTARAYVRFAPDRYDDILWENDRTAHRIYGPALQAYEPPSGSGVDAWGKNVRYPFMDRQLKTKKQHDYHGEGLDFYDVGGARGAGGLGVWFDNKLWVSRNFKTYKILKTGPDVAAFSVDYAPWPVDVGRKVWETRTFTLPTGTNFTRLVSTISSDKPGPLVVGIGISRRKTPNGTGKLLKDKALGLMSFWEPTDPDKGTMGVAILVDPAMVVDITQDAENYLMLVKVTPGKPFVYYMGAGWDKGLDFHSREDWEAYVRAQHPDFSAK